MADKFVPKSDFTQELVRLKMEINNFRQEANAMNSDMKAEIIRWVVGVGVLQMGFIAVLVLKIAD